MVACRCNGSSGEAVDAPNGSETSDTSSFSGQPFDALSVMSSTVESRFSGGNTSNSVAKMEAKTFAKDSSGPSTHVAMSWREDDYVAVTTCYDLEEAAGCQWADYLQARDRMLRASDVSIVP